MDKKRPAASSVDHRQKNRRKRSKKPADMPRRPLSAYNLFFREQRMRILEERKASTTEEKGQNSTGATDSLFASMAKTIARRWKQVSPEELERYVSQASREQTRYRSEMHAYEKLRLADAKKKQKTLVMAPEQGCSPSTGIDSETVVPTQQGKARQPDRAAQWHEPTLVQQGVCRRGAAAAMPQASARQFMASAHAIALRLAGEDLATLQVYHLLRASTTTVRRNQELAQAILFHQRSTTTLSPTTNLALLAMNAQLQQDVTQRLLVQPITLQPQEQQALLESVLRERQALNSLSHLISPPLSTRIPGTANVMHQLQLRQAGLHPHLLPPTGPRPQDDSDLGRR